MKKPLNIGMVGYGFMAKAHSNAYRKVGTFFPELAHRPVLRAVAAATKVWRDFFPSREEVYEHGLKTMREAWNAAA
jgi:predicted dehydrogenase